jgi:hypothetical protein
MVYCDEVSAITPAALVVLGGGMRLAADIPNAHGPGAAPRTAVVVGGWMVVEMAEDDVQLTLGLHAAVHDMVMQRVAQAQGPRAPAHAMPPPSAAHTDQLVAALADLIHHAEVGEPVGEARRMSSPCHDSCMASCGLGVTSAGMPFISGASGAAAEARRRANEVVARTARHRSRSRSPLGPKR